MDAAQRDAQDDVLDDLLEARDRVEKSLLGAGLDPSAFEFQVSTQPGESIPEAIALTLRPVLRPGADPFFVMAEPCDDCVKGPRRCESCGREWRDGFGSPLIIDSEAYLAFLEALCSPPDPTCPPAGASES